MGTPLRPGQSLLTHLAVQENVAPSTQNQALAALLFLYEHALERPLDQIEGVVQARKPKPLPDALVRKYPNADRGWGWQWVFPASSHYVDRGAGVQHRHHLHESVIQKAVRHSPATRLLEDGYNIRTVQALLRHKDVETAMIHTHVANCESLCQSRARDHADRSVGLRLRGEIAEWKRTRYNLSSCRWPPSASVPFCADRPHFMRVGIE